MTIRLLSHGSLVVPVDFKSASLDSFTHGLKHPRNIRLIVLHSAECGEVPGAAEALATWSNGAGHPQASWHFASDSNSITQSCEIDDIAWHAGRVNGYSLGIEQAGRANQTAAQWADEYSLSMLENTARLIAVLAGILSIPIEHVDTELESCRGITTHLAITDYFGVPHGHTDPGYDYPIMDVIDRAQRLLEESDA